MSELLQIVQRRRKPLQAEPAVCPHCGRRSDEPVAVVPPADNPVEVAITELAEQKINPVDEIPGETVAASPATVTTKKSRAKAAAH